jgi:5-methylcytosine-specific restriction endonuclease McrA
MKRKSISKKLRQKLKEEYNNKCGYCGTPINTKFHIDHIEPHFNGGSCEEKNLMAVCISCNLQKGGRSLECFRDLIEDKLNQLKLVANYEVAKRYGLIIEVPKKIVFFFEKDTVV